MRVLGIDPGSTITGFGVIERVRGRVRYVASGCVRTSPDTPMGARLAAIHDALVAAITEYEPDEVAIEAIFHHKNAQSALVLGQARGVALLAIERCHHTAHAYNPMVVKQTIGASGRGDKKAVAKMVTLLLGVEVPGPADVTDALAVAITHSAHAKSAALGVAR